MSYIVKYLRDETEYIGNLKPQHSFRDTKITDTNLQQSGVGVHVYRCKLTPVVYTFAKDWFEMTDGPASKRISLTGSIKIDPQFGSITSYPINDNGMLANGIWNEATGVWTYNAGNELVARKLLNTVTLKTKAHKLSFSLLVRVGTPSYISNNALTPQLFRFEKAKETLVYEFNFGPDLMFSDDIFETEIKPDPFPKAFLQGNSGGLKALAGGARPHPIPENPADRFKPYMPALSIGTADVVGGGYAQPVITNAFFSNYNGLRMGACRTRVQPPYPNTNPGVFRAEIEGDWRFLRGNFTIEMEASPGPNNNLETWDTHPPLTSNGIVLHFGRTTVAHNDTIHVQWVNSEGKKYLSVKYKDTTLVSSAPTPFNATYWNGTGYYTGPQFEHQFHTPFAQPVGPIVKMEHVVIQKSGRVLTVWLNGVQVARATGVVDLAPWNSPPANNNDVNGITNQYMFLGNDDNYNDSENVTAGLRWIKFHRMPLHPDNAPTIPTIDAGNEYLGAR